MEIYRLFLPGCKENNSLVKPSVQMALNGVPYIFPIFFINETRSCS